MCIGTESPQLRRLAAWANPYRGWDRNDALQANLSAQLRALSANDIALTRSALTLPHSHSRCCVTPARDPCPTLRWRFLIVMITNHERLPLVRAQHDAWLRRHDHLVASDWASTHGLVGLRWGGSAAHRALAGLQCAALASRRGVETKNMNPYDWLVVADDDTALDVPRLDLLLTQGHADPSRPIMVGAMMHDVPRLSTAREGARPVACSVPPANGQAAPKWMHACPRPVGVPPRSNGHWSDSVGWPFGGEGIVVSAAAVPVLLDVMAECMRALTCPFFGALQRGRVPQLGVRKDADTMLGFCGIQPAASDVQLGRCFGRAGHVPAAIGRSNPPWSQHLRGARADIAGFARRLPRSCTPQGTLRPEGA